MVDGSARGYIRESAPDGGWKTSSSRPRATCYRSGTAITESGAHWPCVRAAPRSVPAYDVVGSSGVSGDGFGGPQLNIRWVRVKRLSPELDPGRPEPMQQPTSVCTRTTSEHTGIAEQRVSTPASRELFDMTGVVHLLPDNT